MSGPAQRRGSADRTGADRTGADRTGTAATAPDPTAVGRSALSRLGRAMAWRSRGDVLVLVAVVLGTQVFPHRPTSGIYGLGVVSGSLLALDAVAIVLVYRSSRIINVAQLAIGVLAANLFATMVTYEPLLRLFRAVCADTCFAPAPDWFPPFDYAVAAVLSLALAALVSWATYRFVIRYLENAPRFVGTVATVFLVAVIGGVAGKLPAWLASESQKEAQVTIGAPDQPFDLTVHLGGVVFSAQAVLTVAVLIVVVPTLAVFLRRSRTGIAIRAAAEAPAHAATLGIDVRRVTARVWLVAGVFAGLAGVLSTMGSAPPPAGADIDATTLVRVLGAAVVARFVSLPLAAFAAVAFGVLDQATLFGFGSVQPLNAALFVLIGIVLLLQRSTLSRVDVALAGAWRAAREIRPIPAELRDLPTVRSWVRGGSAVVTVVLLTAPWLLSPSQTSLAAFALIATLMFLSLLVLTGWAGQISLGQLAFAAVGGWVVAVTGVPALLALPLGMAAAAVVAVVVGVPALKLRGLQLAIVTLAFNLSVATYLLGPRYLGSALPDTVRRPVLLGMRLDDDRTFYYCVLAALGLAFLAVVGVRRSATARALIAARDNETAAQAFAVQPVRARLGAFAFSGALAGLAGGLIAYQQHAVIGATFSASQSVSLFLYAVIGGLGATTAPLIAGVYFAVVTVFGLPATLVQILTGLGGVLLLIVSRGGLSEVVYGWRDSLLRMLARRHRVVVPSLFEDVSADAYARRRLAIAPKARPGGGAVFVASRYRLDDQYGIPVPTAGPGD